MSQAQNIFKENLLQKLSFVKNSIHQRCTEQYYQIRSNPYLSSVDQRQKRFLGSAVKLAFRSVKTALRSNNFVPKLKTVTRVAGTAAAVGLTGVAIHDLVDSQQFKQDVLDKIEENPTEALHNKILQLQDMHKYYRTTDFKHNKDDLNNEFLSNISNSLHYNTELQATSIILDNLLLYFNAMMSQVESQYDSFMNIIESIISNIPTHDVNLQKAIIETAKQLPYQFSFISDNIYDILNTARVEHSINDTHVTSYIKTSIINPDSSLFLYKAVPLPYKTRSGKSIIPHFETKYVAVTNGYNYYTLINSDELLPCQKGSYFMCQNMNLYTKDSDSCVYAHFMGDNFNAGKVCNFYELSESNLFKLSADHTVHYFVPEAQKAIVTCLTNSTLQYKTSVTLKGTDTYKIPPGCSIETSGFYSVNPKFPIGYNLPKSAAPISNLNKILDLPEDTSFLDNVYIAAGVGNQLRGYFDMQTAYVILIIIVTISLLCGCACKHTKDRVKKWYLIVMSKQDERDQDHGIDEHGNTYRRVNLELEPLNDTAVSMENHINETPDTNLSEDEIAVAPKPILRMKPKTQN